MIRFTIMQSNAALSSVCSMCEVRRSCSWSRVEISVIFESLRINHSRRPVDLDKRGITLNLRLSKLS
jgi:hypothetical protein